MPQAAPAMGAGMPPSAGAVAVAPPPAAPEAGPGAGPGTAAPLVPATDDRTQLIPPSDEEAEVIPRSANQDQPTAPLPEPPAPATG